MNKNESLTIVQTISSTQLEKLKLFLNKDLQIIHTPILKSHITTNHFSLSDYCQLSFWDKGYVSFIKLVPNSVHHPWLGVLNNIDIEAVRVPKPKFKTPQEANDFYSSFFNPASSINMGSKNILQEIHIFGFSEEGTFNENFASFNQSQKEDTYKVQTIEGITFRFKNNKEIILKNNANEFFLTINDEVDAQFLSKHRNELGWEAKLLYFIA